MSDRTDRRPVLRRASVGAVVVAVAMLLALSGCGHDVTSLPAGPGGSTGPNGVVSPSLRSAPTSPSPQASTPGTSPSADRAHIVTVRPTGSSDVAFSSPSGRIWCVISSGASRGAACTIPPGPVQAELPGVRTACAGNTAGDLLGVGVRDGSAHWACGTGLLADPRVGNANPAVGWNTTARFPVVASSVRAGATVVTLPYYHSLVVGPVGCTSYPEYVACGDSATGVSVFVNSHAVSVDGQKAVLPDR